MGEPSLFYKVTFTRTLQRDLVYTTLVATTLKGVSKNISTIFLASSLLIKRPGIDNTFASLCSRASFAISSRQHKAARTPRCLFKVILMPFPVPADSYSRINLASFYGLAHQMGEIRIIATVRRISSKIFIRQSPFIEDCLYIFF